MFSLTRPTILASTKRAFATTSATLPRGEQSIIPLSNVEAQWATLSTEEQAIVHRQLAELQKRDWKSLSRDEKKAGQSIIFILSRLSELASGRQLPKYVFSATVLVKYIEGQNADGLSLHALLSTLATTVCTLCLSPAFTV